MQKKSLLLSFLISVFAIGSWIAINGVWVELPLLVNRLPEGWKLPAFVIVIIQLSNIAPILYMSIFYRWKSKNTERFAIYLILSIGCICCVLLSLFWNANTSIYVNGKWSQYSVSLFVLIWLLSTVDTTSSVTFLPYFINYPRKYITALYVGEGFSGFLPGIYGMIQGVGGEPYCVNNTGSNGTNITSAIIYPPPIFTISVFFILLTITLIICLISFAIIDNVQYFKKLQIKSSQMSHYQMESESASLLGPCKLDLCIEEKEILKNRDRRKRITYVLMVAYINFFTNGVLPSIQNYSLMPYNIKLYHLVVTLTQILNPFACLLTIRQWKTSYILFMSMTVFGSIGAAYIIFLATQSPNAVLGNTVLGEILAVFCWLAVITIFSFEKTLLAIELQKQGHFWLQLCGASTQMGSAVGALLLFILVVIFDVFKSKQIIC